MTTKQQKIEVRVAVTDDQPYEPPQESLRVISNYSSLERMYQRSRNSKIYPHMAPPKRDSFLIAGWDHSPSRERKPLSANRAKFSDPSPITLPISQTIVTERNSITPKTKSKSLEPKNQHILRTTNFKYGAPPPVRESKNYRTLTPRSARTLKTSYSRTVTPDSTLSHQHENYQKQEFKIQKKILLQYYQQQALRSKLKYSWQLNPEAKFSVSEYPVMGQIKVREGRRQQRKQEFLRRHCS